MKKTPWGTNECNLFRRLIDGTFRVVELVSSKARITSQQRSEATRNWIFVSIESGNHRAPTVSDRNSDFCERKKGRRSGRPKVEWNGKSLGAPDWRYCYRKFLTRDCFRKGAAVEPFRYRVRQTAVSGEKMFRRLPGDKHGATEDRLRTTEHSLGHRRAGAVKFRYAVNRNFCM